MAPDITTITYMQEMTPTLCANTAEHVTTTLTDSRDGKNYTVAKLKDGKCWMAHNLMLTTRPGDLTPNDTDISSNWRMANESSNFGTSCVNAQKIYHSSDSTQYSQYGTYYNWYAATAGTGTCEMTSGEAPSSICPKGWKLPTGGTASSDIYGLYSFYAQDNLNPPLSLVLSGEYVGDFYNQGSMGEFWSSTAITIYGGELQNWILLSFHGRIDDYMQSYPRNPGLTVRCVAR